MSDRTRRAALLMVALLLLAGGLQHTALAARGWNTDRDSAVDPPPDRDAAPSGHVGDRGPGDAAAFAGVGIFMVLYFGFFAFMMLFAIGSIVAMVLAIWDCIRRDFPDANSQAAWCILIVLTRWLGALIYYLVVYRSNNPPLKPQFRQTA